MICSNGASIAVEGPQGPAPSDLPFKAPCRFAALGNLPLSGLAAFEGKQPAAGNRILATGQTNAALNGIYIADTGPWVRALDFDDSRDVTFGTLVQTIDDGSVQGVIWRLTSPNPINLGTSAITFEYAFGQPQTFFITTSPQTVKQSWAGGWINVNVPAGLTLNVPADLSSSSMFMIVNVSGSGLIKLAAIDPVILTNSYNHDAISAGSSKGLLIPEAQDVWQLSGDTELSGP